MALKALITVKDDSTHEVVARFVYADDALVFAAASTANPSDSRQLRVEDKAGYYNELFINGVATGLRL